MHRRAGRSPERSGSPDTDGQVVRSPERSGSPGKDAVRRQFELAEKERNNQSSSSTKMDFKSFFLEVLDQERGIPNPSSESRQVCEHYGEELQATHDKLGERYGHKLRTHREHLEERYGEELERLREVVKQRPSNREAIQSYLQHLACYFSELYLYHSNTTKQRYLPKTIEASKNVILRFAVDDSITAYSKSLNRHYRRVLPQDVIDDRIDTYQTRLHNTYEAERYQYLPPAVLRYRDDMAKQLERKHIQFLEDNQHAGQHNPGEVTQLYLAEIQQYCQKMHELKREFTDSQFDGINQLRDIKEACLDSGYKLARERFTEHRQYSRQFLEAYRAVSSRSATKEQQDYVSEQLEINDFHPLFESSDDEHQEIYRR